MYIKYKQSKHFTASARSKNFFNNTVKTWIRELIATGIQGSSQTFSACWPNMQLLAADMQRKYVNITV